MANFKVLDLAVQLIVELRPVVERIQQRDRDLANQLRRSGSSIPLNLSEGTGRSGKDRIHHYRIAAGSAAEAQTTLRVAQAWGYIDSAEAPEHTLVQITAILWRLTH